MDVWPAPAFHLRKCAAPVEPLRQGEPVAAIRIDQLAELLKRSPGSANLPTPEIGETGGRPPKSLTVPPPLENLPIAGLARIGGSREPPHRPAPPSREDLDALALMTPDQRETLHRDVRACALVGVQLTPAAWLDGEAFQAALSLLRLIPDKHLWQDAHARLALAIGAVWPALQSPVIDSRSISQR